MSEKYMGADEPERLEISSRQQIEENVRRIIGDEASQELVEKLVEYVQLEIKESLLLHNPGIAGWRLPAEVIDDFRTLDGLG